MSYFSGDDLVFYKENDKIMSGGYLINSIMLKEGIAPMTTFNENYLGGNKDAQKVSELFDNLAVPAGLFYVNPKKNDECEYEVNHAVLSDDIHDKLFELIEFKKKKQTKKQKIKSTSNKKISRKNK
jgi:hypothetical protein